MRRRAAIVVALLVGVHPRPAIGQDVTHRGFVEARVTLFPQQTSNDQRRVVGDLLAREDVLVRPSSWLRFAGGFEARGNSYDQVEPSWRVRVNDRTSRRPALALRRLVATITRGGLAVDIGKQFVRWGKADIVTHRSICATRLPDGHRQRFSRCARRASGLRHRSRHGRAHGRALVHAQSRPVVGPALDGHAGGHHDCGRESARCLAPIGPDRRALESRWSWLRVLSCLLQRIQPPAERADRRHLVRRAIRLRHW